MSTGVDNGPGQPSAPQPPAFPALYPTTPPRPVHRPAAREPIVARRSPDPQADMPPAPPTVPPQSAVPPAAAPPFPSQPAAPPMPPVPPARRPRTAGSRAISALCFVLGLGLFAGAAAGAWINHEPAAGEPAADTAARTYAVAGELWRRVPVDTLFPPTVNRPTSGPGGADRTWTRIGVAPAAGCARAVDPLLAKVLAPVVCVRVLRATYVDATSSRVTTVGLVVTGGDVTGMRALNRRWSTEHLGSRTDLMPHPVAFPGTAAASFADGQRASWTVSVSATLPLVVYAVSGFADGRTIPEPQPADEATAKGATTAPAQAGLGKDALVLSADLDTRLHKAATIAATSPGEASR
ncbi:hypothetical protein QMK19_27335 [Streptomyces sp. H10-C2]|uniref:hypothetical protein n=1 Tax=unclassified Streptomyces TaxID=2593676 RepID=UPI0024B9E01E|nr:MULTISPECIES: hypothetical protein [unclassified Streptomyces]MDJ0343748.1 hypothetical protein [Streptomyces sp. PH10-H1]MDJ0373269.1 hypothetical protein [Streptomyces sp. H10-C2]